MITLSPQFKELVKPIMFVGSVLWFALTASIGIYVLVAYLTAAQQPPGDLPEGVVVALVVASAVAALISLFIPRFLLSDQRILNALQKGIDPESFARSPKSGLVDEERLSKVQALDSRERSLLHLPGLFFTNLIVRLVINEAVAIFGLIFSLLSHTFQPILPFAAVAAALNMATLPRIEPLLDRASRLVR